MPTEEEARVLLAEAAATIAVDETAPASLTGLPEPAPRRWPVVAAAAAVVLAIGGGYLVARQVGQEGGDDDRPEPAPASSGSTPEALDPDQLPSLIGYTEDEAIAELQQRGYAVQVHVVPSGCDVAGIVLGTSPVVGTRMAAGDPVTLHVVGKQQVVDCVGEVPWHLVWDVVRSSRGLASPASMTGADVPAEVRSAVDAMVAHPPLGGGIAGTVQAAWVFDHDPCWPAEQGGGLRFWLEPQVDRQSCPATSAVIEYGADRVRSVRIDTSPSGDDGPIATDELAASLDRTAAAERFVSWARGEGPAPAFADRVRVLYGGGPAPGSTGWVDDPEDRARYAGCSGPGFPDCGLDPVALLARYDGHVVPTAGRSICADGGEVPPRLADATDDVVRLEEPEPRGCQDTWAVELWIDEAGVVYAVNQAGAGV